MLAFALLLAAHRYQHYRRRHQRQGRATSKDWCHHQHQRAQDYQSRAEQDRSIRLAAAPRRVQRPLAQPWDCLAQAWGLGSLARRWSVEWRRAQTQLLLCLTVGSAARTPKRGGRFDDAGCEECSSVRGCVRVFAAELPTARARRRSVRACPPLTRCQSQSVSSSSQQQ